VIDAAIIGLGRWGQGFVEAIQGHSERLRFVRGVDRSADKIRDYAAQHGFVATESLADVLCDPAVRAVVLATPHSLHREQVVACAEAGKQVFCEKPLALTLRDALRMVEACRAAGVVLAVGHNRRFWPSFRTLREIVARGELGDILHIEGHNSNENSNAVRDGWRLKPEESPAGGMTGAGLHVLDAFVSLLGPPARVRTQLIERKTGPAPLDSLVVTLEFPGGIVEPGESPERAGARELQEETGFVATRWTSLGSCYPNPALQTNRLHTFVAHDCRKTSEPRLDPGEDARVELVPAASLKARVLGGEITHGLVLASLFQAATRGVLP